MHPRHIATANPDKPAVIMEPGGATLTYGELEARANQVARLFRDLGVQRGEAVAFCLENCPEVFEFCWGAQRAGLYFVPISSRLTPSELAYIVEDSGARVLLTSANVSAARTEVAKLTPGITRFTTGAGADGFDAWASARDAQPDTAIADESRGMVMFYSSGTTGRPKGVAPAAPSNEPPDAPDLLSQLVGHLLGATADSVYLTPAPLYHAAPLGWTMAIQRLGATTIILSKFDAELALDVIERRQISCGQFVPTHFVRMLKLPEEVRNSKDISSLKAVIHAAAPCPIPVKEAMIDWWGPIVQEYYAGSEGNGMTFISAPEWLEHKGSVGKAVFGTVHICNEEGEELPAREEGLVYFEGGNDFSYHNDPEKTREVRNQHGWSTLGDIGWMDEDGYLYLTDRKSFMIISGGVNIYPQEIENVLVDHPKVMDAAVVGGPDPEMGEKVIAVIQPLDFAEAGEDLAAELSSYCRQHLSGVKIPRQIDFMAELPRAQTGKLYKRLLRDRYWAKASA